MPAKQSPPPEPTVAPLPPAAASPSLPPQAAPLSPNDERTWSMLAHLSLLLNLVTGFAGIIAAFVIYLVYKDRSRLVAYHALQSTLFQLICWFGGGVLIGVMWTVVGILSAIVIGIVLIPFAAVLTFVFGLLPIGAIIYCVIGAIQTSQGQDFKYWLIGDWVRSTLTS